MNHKILKAGRHQFVVKKRGEKMSQNKEELQKNGALRQSDITTIKISKTRAKEKYVNSKGEFVPGVTTVLSVLNKPALVKWANNLGLRGIDSSKYRDEKAEIGRLAHAMILAHYSEKKLDTSEFSKKEIDQAENCLLSFFEWQKSNPVEPILVETPLVSEVYGYGGMPDLYGRINGETWLIDFKTGSGIYPEMLYQLAAYQNVLKEAGYQVERARILRIGRDETEGFEEKIMTDLSLHFKIFDYCLSIYELQKLIKGGGK